APRRRALRDNPRAVPYPRRGREDATPLAYRLAAGPVEQAPPPSPQFADLTRRLAAAGIRVELAGTRHELAAARSDTHTPHPRSARVPDPHTHTPKESLRFSFAPPNGDVLELARPVPHPWLSARELSVVAAMQGMPEFEA